MVLLVKLSIMPYVLNFQVRGSPQIHSFIGIENAPKLTAGKIENYILWVDSIISAKLPDIDNSKTIGAILI